MQSVSRFRACDILLKPGLALTPGVLKPSLLRRVTWHITHRAWRLELGANGGLGDPRGG